MFHSTVPCSRTEDVLCAIQRPQRFSCFPVSSEPNSCMLLDFCRVLRLRLPPVSDDLLRGYPATWIYMGLNVGHMSRLIIHISRSNKKCCVAVSYYQLELYPSIRERCIPEICVRTKGFLWNPPRGFFP